MRCSLLPCVLVGFALAGCSSAPSLEPSVDNNSAYSLCSVGVYGGESSFLAITKYDNGFRYNFSDGRVGSISVNSSVQCLKNAVTLDGSTVLEKRFVRVTDTRFAVKGAELAGQLLEPKNASPSTPLVVYAHGSEERGWIESVRDPYQMVGRGISVFVYDKRGTGLSSGAYSQNFPQLADDLVAAATEAKRLAKNRFGRFGLFGLSQGGWIAPLAAERSNADFIGIGYGLVVDILEEDAAQVELELQEAGYGDDILAKAQEVTNVTALIAKSGYKEGLNELDSLQTRYGQEPWFQNLKGGFSGVILGMSSEELRTNGIPMFDRLNIDWSLVPMDVLRRVAVPQLWVLAKDDREAPISKTMERLQTLRNDGKDISIYVFPGTDHGMWEYQEASDGSRKVTRVTNGFYELMADWAKGDVRPPYNNSKKK